MEYESPYELFKQVGEYVSSPLGIAPDALVAESLEAQQLQLKLANVLRELHYTLNTRRMAAKQPKDKYITDLDREVEIKGATAQLQADYEFIITLQEIIKERLDTTRQWLTMQVADNSVGHPGGNSPSSDHP